MRLLPGPRPDVHVPVGEVLALPAERAVLMGQGLEDEIDRFPEALDVAQGVGVARRHLGAARLDEADVQPSARHHVGRGVLLGHPHRVLADRDQGAQAQDPHPARLPGQHAQDQRAGPEEAVDPGMVLVGDDVDPDVVAQEVLVERLLEQVGGDCGDRSTCWAGWPARNPRCPGRAAARTDRDSRSGTRPAFAHSFRKATTRSAKASGCSISGWWPARSMSAKRAPGMAAA